MNDIAMSIASASEIMAMERVERDAWLDLFVAGPIALGPSATVQWERAGSYALIADRNVPISEFNRCIGLGVDAAFTQSDLDQAMVWLDRYASPNWSIQLPPQDSAETIAGWMQRRGLERAGTGWAKFFRRAESAGESAAQSDLTVRELSPEYADHFGAAIVAGFGLPAWVAQWFAFLVGRPRWRVYIAYDGETPVACGVLYSDAGWGWMGCDATLSDHRGRGAQTALIRRRIGDAAAAGIEMLTAETGQPAPGLEQGNRSYRNYRKAGFTKAYVRPNYRRV
jgi:ribosomal protein S18 acetylase RimI-like enzyme